MYIYIIILIIICIFSLKLTCRNYEILIHSIKWCISFLFGINYNFSNTVLPKEISYVIIRNITDIKKIEKNRFKFVDFGCGEGNILFLVRDLFDQLDGIEIDKKMATKAKNNLSKFSNINIKNLNMQYYNYEPVNTILYFFEPISILNIKEENIYETVFKKIEKTFRNTDLIFYIIYVTDIFKLTYKNVLSELFDKYGFDLVKKTSCCFRKICIYKYRSMINMCYNTN